MKKFVLIDSWGHWKKTNGKTVIGCTVCGYNKIAESNDRNDLKATARTEYRADGTWHSFAIVKRAEAKRLGLV